MNCTDIHLLLHAYVDGELDLVRSLEVERHIKSCTSCAAKMDSLRSLHSTLQNSELAYRTPDSLRKKVKRMAGGEVRETRRSDLQWIWKWLAAGATAFAVVTLFLRPAGISEHDQLMAEAVGSHVRSLMQSHLTDVASSDQHTVKPWFDGKLDFAPDVKDFAEQGYPLIGGRLDYLGGHDVAALVYRRNKHVINVFVWPAKGEAMKSETEIRQGYVIINRDMNGMHYCVVSDLNEKELGDLVDMIGK